MEWESRLTSEGARDHPWMYYIPPLPLDAGFTPSVFEQPLAAMTDTETARILDSLFAPVQALEEPRAQKRGRDQLSGFQSTQGDHKRAHHGSDP